jgi:hypothetical protein
MPDARCSSRPSGRLHASQWQHHRKHRCAKTASPSPQPDIPSPGLKPTASPRCPAPSPPTPTTGLAAGTYQVQRLQPGLFLLLPAQAGHCSTTPPVDPFVIASAIAPNANLRRRQPPTAPSPSTSTAAPPRPTTSSSGLKPTAPIPSEPPPSPLPSAPTASPPRSLPAGAYVVRVTDQVNPGIGCATTIFRV